MGKWEERTARIESGEAGPLETVGTILSAIGSLLILIPLIAFFAVLTFVVFKAML